ncbi:helix-turn-helix domain-containing protein [Streptomyces sp. A012304]|uniref:helix-turn-helix domain-containing protein n=1 Tax=Streptomyces sp. A012304 TaxID=375446 RepID=UPI00222F43ED|nr:helix-turn-helix domain-containing protein [Streptomyces sp. A012304]GKQ33772.1 hypothetical protein ALMP_03230 [Streptomyces sp. A012304]
MGADDLPGTATPGDPSPPLGLVVVGHFDQGPGYGVNRPHGSDSWLFTWTTSGRGRLRQGRTGTRAGPGDLTILAPGVPHRYATDPDASHWRFWWTHCQARPTWTPWLRPYESGDGVYVVGPVPHDLRERLEAAFRRAHSGARLAGGDLPGAEQPTGPGLPGGPPAGIAVAHATVARELALCALEEAVLLATASARSPLPPPGGDDRIRRAQDRIAADPGAAHTVRSLAAEAALSPSRFAHLFTEQVGQSPMRALREARLRHAARLLEVTGLSVERVAAASGFVSPFHFTRLFRARYGMPPGAYRDGMRAANHPPEKDTNVGTTLMANRMTNRVADPD